MKNNRGSVLFIILISGFITNAQIIDTDPEIPVVDQPVTIYFDATQGTAGLRDYSGDVYAHTGVLTDKSTSGSDWKYVKTNWGQNTSETKLTRISPNYYKLDIAPTIRDYYGVPVTEKITHMAFVFRSDFPYTGSSYYEGKETGGKDIFAEVFESGLNINLTTPEHYALVVVQNDTISVNASATYADSISLFINGAYIKTGEDSTSLTYTIIAGSAGENRVKVIAYAYPDFVADSFFYYVRQDPVIETLPDGLRDGINYTSDTSVTLVLFAPLKDYVFVIGDITEWLALEKGYMKITPDGEKFWLDINGLIPGKEYRYQYLVDGELRIADPYADKLLDPWNDPYIAGETYPGLIEYPKDMTSGIVSVFQTAQQNYQWQITDFQPPALTSLVIYELLVRDYIASHDYKTLTDTLDYLDNLGINAIELMPVNEFEGNLSWGYNPSFYFAPDKYYGPKDDLKTFIDSCHGRGIAVILDMVLNHSYGQSPLVQLYFNSTTWKPTPENPWYNVDSPNPVFSWGYDFNHESKNTREFVDRVNTYWLTEYQVDGFRFDFTKGFTNIHGDGGAYDASRISILKRMAGQIWNVNPDAYVILEHFADNTEEKELAEYGMMLWANMNNEYANAAMGYSSNLSWGTSKERGWEVPNLVTYMESHDEERIMYKIISGGLSLGEYDTRDPETALERMELAAVFFLTIPGPKMIWQFGELGYDISINYNGRTGEKPLKWYYYYDTDHKHLYQVYSFLNSLRRNHEVFMTTDYSYLLSSILKRINLNDPGMNVTVIGNFDITEGTIDPNFQDTGTWYEYFTGDSIAVTNVNELISLQPGECRLYSDKKLVTPEFILNIDHNSDPRHDYSTVVYPNPSKDNFHIRIMTSHPVTVSIDIFDITGKVVRKLASGYPANGMHVFQWDGKTDGYSEAEQGMYFVQVVTPEGCEMLKVIKE